MLGSPISRNSVLLALFAALTTSVIAGTYLGTRDRIAEARRAAEQRALFEIVPPARHDNDLLADTLPVGPTAVGLRLRNDKRIFIARERGEVVAVILPVNAPDGYSGNIELIVGINRDGSVAGVRALQHRETPGLGDKVDLKKSDWVLDFAGRSLGDPSVEQWAVRKDGGVFDQFTGATITPRAVITAVKRSLEYFEDNRERLLGSVEDDNREQDRG
jgi:electron transport complex protein RnfG